MSAHETPRSELSHLVTPSELGRGDVIIEIEADARARAGLVRRFGLLELPALRATVRLTRQRGGNVLSVAGRIEARVVQMCVVTLEPVAYAIEAPFEVRFVPADAGDGAGDGDGGVADIESVDEAEPLFGDSLDVGEVVAVELALALDSYPRNTGATLDTGLDSVEKRRNFRRFRCVARAADPAVRRAGGPQGKQVGYAVDIAY